MDSPAPGLNPLGLNSFFEKPCETFSKRKQITFRCPLKIFFDQQFVKIDKTCCRYEVWPSMDKDGRDPTRDTEELDLPGQIELMNEKLIFSSEITIQITHL